MKKVWPWLKKNWQGVGLVLAVIIGFILVWNTASALGDGIRKIFGIKDNPEDFTPVPLPLDNLSEAEAAQVRSIVMRLHTDLSGFGISFMRDEDVWLEFMSLSNPLFVAVYNDFSNMYAAEGSGTLRKWVEDEWGGWTDFAGIAGKSQVLERMSALNLQ